MKGTDTKTMLTEFQLEQKIIGSKDEDGAGTYGPKTRVTLAALHAKYLEKHNTELVAIEKARNLLLTDHDAWEKQYKQAETTVNAFGKPRLKETNDGIRLLQSFLLEKKYFTGNLDGKMTGRTLVAIRKYQTSKNIKPTGSLDDTTRSAMIDDIAMSL